MASLLELISRRLASISRSLKDPLKQEVYGNGLSRNFLRSFFFHWDLQSDIRPSRLYDDRLPPEPKYPSTLPSEADWPEREKQVSNDGADQDGQPLACEIVKHAPPGSSAHMCDGTKMALIMCEACRPCYKGLTNNVSTRLMKMKLNSWPAGTEDYVNHRVLNEYIQDTCFKTGVHSRTYYDTRVEKVLKSGKGWKVHTSTLTKNQARFQRVEREWVGL